MPRTASINVHPSPFSVIQEDMMPICVDERLCYVVERLTIVDERLCYVVERLTIVGERLFYVDERLTIAVERSPESDHPLDCVEILLRYLFKRVFLRSSRPSEPFLTLARPPLFTTLQKPLLDYSNRSNEPQE